MNKLHAVLGTAVIINFLLVGVLYFRGSERHQVVGFVRTADVLERYTGMKELQNTISKKQSEVSVKLDTLHTLYVKAKLEFEQIELKGSKLEREKAQKVYLKRESDYNRFKDYADKKIEEEAEELTEGILNQINGKVQWYAEENDIDLVIGSTVFGNVLYGRASIDITEDIIQLLNSDY